MDLGLKWMNQHIIRLWLSIILVTDNWCIFSSKQAQSWPSFVARHRPLTSDGLYYTSIHWSTVFKNKSGIFFYFFFNLTSLTSVPLLLRGGYCRFYSTMLCLTALINCFSHTSCRAETIHFQMCWFWMSAMNCKITCSLRGWDHSPVT